MRKSIKILAQDSHASVRRAIQTTDCDTPAGSVEASCWESLTLLAFQIRHSLSNGRIVRSNTGSLGKRFDRA